ncbi:MAG TPA: FeoB-associated Cys-rich membrane protein [Sporolactobacillaceae bacterium]|nr:FeoB-associated Cys-rich membrane protein [Sporolactobacillaceae bacterium]
MIVSFVLGILIFGYAAWTLVRFIQKSKKGKCATCSLSKSCQVCDVATNMENALNKNN